jgi:beta-phosphoglucomutase family hydrolase
MWRFSAVPGEMSPAYDGDVSAGSIVDWAAFRAVLLDLDGVVTPTALIHEKAWSELFAPWGFTNRDYLAYVDGRPRYEGVKTFLDARHVELPWGDPSDPPGDNTICAMGNRKDETFNAVLDRQGIDPYPGTLKVMDLLDRSGVPMAIVSSSKNARHVLEVAGISERFVTVVDGDVAVEHHLAGKPKPDTFVFAAQQLGVAPAEAVVVEDATSGVAAGRAGNFALVLGVDRGGNRGALAEAGADLVVGDLDETVA